MDDQLENKARSCRKHGASRQPILAKHQFAANQERQHPHLLNQYNLYSQLPNTTNHPIRHLMTPTAGQGTLHA